ncbi:MAG: site-2 protease family protein [Phycisphaerales bacterium]|nr:site-2 protease family protein [Phycisphaerales bacterium]
MQFPIVYVYEQLGMPGVAAFLFWGLAAVVLHELGHGWAAVWQGDDTPIRYNRLTLNPLVHMGWTSIVFLCMVGIAWGSMPTDPSRFRWGRKGRVVVALAGPAVNLVLALLSLVVLAIMNAYHAKQGTDASGQAVLFWWRGANLNLLLLFFNLLPLPPLDGAQALAGVSRTFWKWLHDPTALRISFIALLVFMFSGLSSFMFEGVEQVGLMSLQVFSNIAASAFGVPPSQLPSG